MCHHIRTQASSHGGRSQSGELGQRRTTIPPWQRGVGSKTKEVSGAPSRNCSRRSKNTATCTSLCHQWSYSYYVMEWMTWSSFILRGGDEKKDKSGEKTPENQNSGEHDTAVKTAKHLEMNHGTAVWMPVSLTHKHTQKSSRFSWNAVVNLLITFPPHLESPLPQQHILMEKISHFIFYCDNSLFCICLDQIKLVEICEDFMHWSRSMPNKMNFLKLYVQYLIISLSAQSV